MLLGRGSERARIDRLLTEARGGGGGVLVLRGEAGIGKTTLLEYGAERADEFQHLHALGVESESELAFAGLHELLRPLLDRLDALPDVQADALRVALALARGRAADLFAVSVAALSLLVEAAHERPLLCLVDDAQWLDHASAETLRFVGRRLDRDAVALLIAAREGEERTFESPELPELHVAGLHREAAEALLALAAPELAPETTARVLELAHGNPLALREVPAALAAHPDEPATPGPLPVGPRLERTFAARARTLPEETQAALLVAAAADTGEVAVLADALAGQGLELAALTSAERAKLILVADGSFRFSHPLVRSAVYQAAPADARRRAHAALAEALRSAGAAERYPWHLAAAAAAPDEEVASALERAARDARARGGVAAEARALERAARLTPDPARRAHRLIAAARAARAAGRGATAQALAEEALRERADERAWAEAHAVLADIHYWHGRRADVLAIAKAEKRLVAADPRAAAAVLFWAALSHGAEDPRQALELTERALELAPDNLFAAVGRANYLFRLGRAAEAEAVTLALAESTRRAGDWYNAAEVAVTLGALERYDEARALGLESIRGLQAEGALKQLSHALVAQTQVETRRGDLRAAYELGTRSLDLGEAIGEPLQIAFSASFLAACEALMGLEEAVRQHAEQALESVPGETVRMTLEARAALGLVELQLGRTDEAAAELERVVAALRSLGIEDPGYVQAQPELVEALVRGGRSDEAEAVLDELERQARATRRLWALAAAARCRGLLAPEDDFDAPFTEALEWHAQAERPLEQARTELAYGERLRRAARRREARERLRAALATFESAGARLFAERARTELAATGERVRRSEEAREELSPQELQVALVVSRGATNKEAAAELFLSPKTIEFHLRNAFRKLGVRSRTELANALRGGV